MELHHLRCAVAIAEHGTFTDAASALHLTQPSLSYAIAQLEQELGARLFERKARGATLTAAGEAFLVPARRTLAEADRCRPAVDAVHGIVSGELSIVTVRTAVAQTASAVARFHEQFPNVRLSIEDPTGDGDVVQLIRTRRCEIGVMRRDFVPADLDAVGFGTECIVVLFPAATAPIGKRLRLRDVAATGLIVPARGTKTRASHDAMLANLGIDPPVVAESSNLQMSIELVRRGVGAVITSESPTLYLEGIAVRSLSPRVQAHLSAVWRPSGASPAAIAFIETLQQNER